VLQRILVEVRSPKLNCTAVEGHRDAVQHLITVLAEVHTPAQADP
jgi:hypothetical protein